MAPAPTTHRDAGTELRRALGLSEPSYLTGSRTENPAYFGGYRNAEDQRDFEDIETRRDEAAARAERDAKLRGEAA